MLGPGGEVLWLVRCWTITASIHPQICLRNQSVGTVGKSVDTVGKSVDTVGKSINGLSWKISGHSGHSWKINQWTQLENQSTQLENQSVDAAGKSISGHSWKMQKSLKTDQIEFHSKLFLKKIATIFAILVYIEHGTFKHYFAKNSR